MQYQLKDTFCINCNHNHFFKDGILMCSDRFCVCMSFTNSESLVLTGHQRALDKLHRVKEKIRYMYEKIGGFENYNNKSFVFAYWHLNFNFCTGMELDGKTYYRLTDPETVRRARQKFVEENPQYQSNDTELNYHKQIKFNAIVEFALEDKT